MRNYYVLSHGRVRREQNTIFIENAEGQKKPLPVEDVDSLYLYGEIDLNTRLLNFLSQQKIPLHVFNYYGFYGGSYYPREYLHSGFLLVHQVGHYSHSARRLALARELVQASAHSLLRNIAYYARRRSGEGSGTDAEPKGEIGGDSLDELSETASHSAANAAAPSTAIPTDASAEIAIDAALTLPPTDAVHTNPWEPVIDFDTGEVLTASSGDVAGAVKDDPQAALNNCRATIENLVRLLPEQTLVDAVRGIEGKMRVAYYRAWRHIIGGEWAFERRVRRPPDNEINALIGFGNGFLSTVCLSEIYRTQLTPTISYMHEPGARRFSLALDLSEIFKPLIVDRAIFRLLNTGQLKPGAHFDKNLDGCYLTDAGKKLFLNALEERLASTIQHRRLGRSVSYRHLIRLECYKLIRHLTEVESYRAFRAWW